MEFSLGVGLAALGAGISMGIAAIGAGIGVGIAGAAGAGVIVFWVPRLRYPLRWVLSVSVQGFPWG